MAPQFWENWVAIDTVKCIRVAKTERAIASKLSRGTFSFAFFIQCMKALGCERVELNLREIDAGRTSTLD